MEGQPKWLTVYKLQIEGGKEAQHTWVGWAGRTWGMSESNSHVDSVASFRMQYDSVMSAVTPHH